MSLLNPDADHRPMKQFQLLAPKPIILDGPINELDFKSLKPLRHYIYASATPFVEEDVYRDPKEMMPAMLTEYFATIYNDSYPDFYRSMNLPYRFSMLSHAQRDLLCENRINLITNFPGRGPVMQGHDLFGTHISLPELVIFGSLIAEIFNFSHHNPSLANSLGQMGPDNNSMALHHIFHHLNAMLHNLKARRLLPPIVNASVVLNKYPDLVYTRKPTQEEREAEPDIRQIEYTLNKGGLLIKVGTMVAAFNCDMHAYHLLIFGSAYNLIENVLGFDNFAFQQVLGTGEKFVKLFNHRIEVNRMQQMEKALDIAANLAFLNPLERKDIDLPLILVHAGVPQQ